MRYQISQLNLGFIAGLLVGGVGVSLYTALTLSLKPSPSALGVKRRKVCLFGDSITQHGWNSEIMGWSAALAHYYFRRIDVLNRGYSGYNTRWALALVDDVVINDHPDFITLFFGANDSVDERVLQHVPITEYRTNLESIVQKIQMKLPHVPIVIITPPPIWEKKLEELNRSKNKPVILDRTNERAREYAVEAIKVSSKYNIPCLDIWTLMEGPSDARQLYLSDGLHLSALYVLYKLV
jgi:lysophospholipase L1-like esterase